MLRWLSVYSAMIAAQAMDRARRGEGGVTEEAMRAYQEEARAVADLEAEVWEGDFPECCPRCGSPSCDESREDEVLECLCRTCNFMWSPGALE